MVWVPVGSFVMGDTQGQGQVDEIAVHRVEITRPFAISQYEITVREFGRFVKNTGYVTDAEIRNGCFMRGGKDWRTPAVDFSQEDDHPVVCVTWRDVNAYITWLSTQTGKPYRLPTEAEWDYAARAGTDTNYWWGNDIGYDKARCGKCSKEEKETGTVAVGSFQPNSLGLYDTAGNAWEWTASKYDMNYAGLEQNVAESSSTEGKRAIKSGGWLNFPEDLRVSNRGAIPATDRYSTLGFRVVRLKESSQ